jgi:hypothetical protein
LKKQCFFLWWRAPQQTLRTHHSLEAYCATLWWRWLVFTVFPCNGAPMEWNWQGKKSRPVTLRTLQITFIYSPGIEPGPPWCEAGT